MRHASIGAVVVGLVAIAGPAHAGSVIANPTLQSGSFTGTTAANARFRIDPTNWDMRLANTGSPASGDPTKNISNDKARLAGSWSFSLSFASATGDLTWTLTDLDQSANLGTHALTINRAGVAFNQIQLTAVAQTDRASHLTFGAFSMTGVGLDNASSIDLDLVAGSGDQFKNAYLVASNVDLTAIDWALSGTFSIDKGTSTSQERPAFNIFLEQSDATPGVVIPTPMAGLLGAAGLGMIGARRRRSTN